MVGLLVEMASLRRHRSWSSDTASLSDTSTIRNITPGASLKAVELDEDQISFLDLDPDPFASSIGLTAHSYEDANHGQVTRTQLLSAKYVCLVSK